MDFSIDGPVLQYFISDGKVYQCTFCTCARPLLSRY